MRIGWISFHREGVPALQALLERGVRVEAVITLAPEQLAKRSGAADYGPFAPPGPPTATISGSISALANVSVKDVPEPSTLLLSGLCLSLCGAGWCWRRARGLALDLA